MYPLDCARKWFVHTKIEESVCKDKRKTREIEQILGERRELYPLDSARERFVCTKRPLNAVDTKRVARVALVVLLVWIQAVHVVKHVKISSSIKPQVRVFPVALPCVFARRTHTPAMTQRERKGG